MRSKTFLPAFAMARNRIASWRLSSSLTLLTLRNERWSWEIGIGASCSSSTTPSCGGSWARFRGHEVNIAGDGFLATFDGPGRAIRCAVSICREVRSLGIDVRAGLHSGECQVEDSKVEGIAVHIGSRVAATAKPGEVLVSSTVKDLVVGSGIAFEDRGMHALKGVPGEWHLFAVAPADEVIE